MASAKHCEHVTGSLVCGSADDQAMGNLNAPSGYTPAVNIPRAGN